MTYACSLSALASLDTGDIEAVQEMLDQCTSMLLDPVLWAWMIGFTVVTIAVGALIGWMKGRTLAGLVWGAALGPIGWIIIALYPVRQKACPRCGKPNLPNARRCDHCHADLTRSTGRGVPSQRA